MNTKKERQALESAAARNRSHTTREKQTMDDNKQTNLLPTLLDLFPCPQVRPMQMAALRNIAHMFEEDNRSMIIEAPTGTGKSALALTAGCFGATLNDDEFEAGAHILTPYNNLATQMTEDYGLSQGLARLSGRKFYDRLADGNGRILYERAKSSFLESSLGVTTYAYFLNAQHLPRRQVLILDEAHNLERIFVDRASFKIIPQHCRDLGIGAPPRVTPQEEGQIVDWLAGVFLPALKKRIDGCREKAALREYENLAERIVA